MVTGDEFIERLRREAQKRKRARGIGYTVALNQLAHEIGYKDWPDLLWAKNQNDQKEKEVAQ